MRHESALRAGVMPRALIGGLRAVRAEATDPKAILANLTTGFETFKAKYDGRLGDIEAALDSQAIGIAANRANGGGTGLRPVDAPYSAQFNSYVRSGDIQAAADLRVANSQGTRMQINAAMSEGSAADGGYLTPIEWDRQIHRAALVFGAMRRLSTVQTTSVQAFSTVWSNFGWGSGWVGETAARPATTNAQLSPIVFASGEIYAMPAATQRVLDDSEVDVPAWLTNELALQFSIMEGIAFVSGDGVNKPYGFLQYTPGGTAATIHPGGTLDVVNSGSATTIPSMDILRDMSYGLLAPYRPNASWLMSSTTAAVLSKLKDGFGMYLWQPSLILGQPDLLLGRPVELDENMPPVAAGNYAVAFGDFRAGYLINDRTGVRILRDPFTNKPFVNFYSTRRVGGGVLDPRAIRVLKISA